MLTELCSSTNYWYILKYNTKKCCINTSHFVTYIIKTTCTQELRLIIFTTSSRTFISETDLLLQVHGSEGVSDYYYNLMPLAWFMLRCQQFYPTLRSYCQWKCQLSEKVWWNSFNLADPLKESWGFLESWISLRNS